MPCEFSLPDADRPQAKFLRSAAQRHCCVREKECVRADPPSTAKILGLR